LESFSQQRRTLTALVLPMFDMAGSGDSVLRFYTTLTSLRQMRLTSRNVANPLVMDVARSCTELRDIYLDDCEFSTAKSLLAFLNLVPNLDVLHLQGGEYQSLVEPSLIPDLLSTLPLQNRKIRTLALHHLYIPRLLSITS
jgi:hypothetical protein